MDKEIRIIDSDCNRYSVEPKQIILGRTFDNESETISIIRPDTEKNSICTWSSLDSCRFNNIF